MLNWFLIKRFMFVTMSSTSISKMITWPLKVVFIHAEEDKFSKDEKALFLHKNQKHTTYFQTCKAPSITRFAFLSNTQQQSSRGVL